MANNLTSKGQVTVPKKVRDYLGLKPGAAVTFERLDNGEIALRATKAGAPPHRGGMGCPNPNVPHYINEL